MAHKKLIFLHNRWKPWLIAGLLILGMALLAGCQSGWQWQGYLTNQPKYLPLSPSELFTDGRSSRPLPANTVSQSTSLGNDPFFTGKGPDGKDLTDFPIQVTLDVVRRGQQRFNIYCSPCHGYDGYGKGMIVQRGFSTPPSFHDDRLRQAPVGHFFDVITNGFGRMYSYAYRVEPADRWAIIAYIRALQLSQDAKQQDVPQQDQQKLGP